MLTFVRILALWLLAGFCGATAGSWFASDDSGTGVPTQALRVYRQQLGGFIRGDLGHSSAYSRPVTDLLKERLPVTLRTAVVGLVLGWTVAFALALVNVFWNEARWIQLSLCSAVAAGFVVFGAPASWAIAAVLLPRLLGHAHNQISDCRVEQPPTWSRGVLPAAGVLAVSIAVAMVATIPVEILYHVPGAGDLAWTAAIKHDAPLLVSVTLVLTGIAAAAGVLREAAPA